MGPRELVGLASGVIFGAGLAVSQMIDPAKVLSFLDLFGAWDPSLVLVMAAAIAVAALPLNRTRRGVRPWLAELFELPTRRDIDGQLIFGAALFGVGWGLVGLCPGPAIAALALGHMEVVVFVASMVIGMGCCKARSCRATSAK